LVALAALAVAVPALPADPTPAPTAAAPAAPAEVSPVGVVQDLCDSLVSAMKSGESLGFEGRRKALAPEISRDLNLPLMTRIVVGPKWAALAPTDRDALVTAFSDFSIANYANQFSSYSGEVFKVQPVTSTQASGDVVVKSVLIPKNGDAVHLDYLLRKTAGQWRVIDVFFNGTISSLAARRSEYSATLSQKGASGLVTLLRQKTAELSH
jgi:phospholipid transport system substrate-binding protein